MGAEVLEGASNGAHYAGTVRHAAASGATAPYRGAPLLQRAAVDADHGLFVVVDVEIHGTHDESLAQGILDAMRQTPPARTARLGSLAGRILAADQFVAARSRAERGGATLAALELAGAWASIARLGDSAAFRARGRELVRLTDDDDLARGTERRGRADDEIAEALETHSSVILSALTGTGLSQIEVVHVAVRPGDRFLLTTDGLTRLTTHDAMALVMAEPGLTLAERCERLLALRGERRYGDAVVLLVEPD